MDVRRVLAWLMVISFVFLLISVLVISVRLSEANRLDPLELEVMTHDQIIARVYEVNDRSSIGLSFLLPAFGFFGVVVGAIVFFLLEPKRSGPDARSIVMLVRNTLSDQEREVFDLLRSRGSLFQSEVSSMKGFTKVRAHRVVSDLERKGVVTRTAAGKQRVIRFSSDLAGLVGVKEDGFTE